MAAASTTAAWETSADSTSAGPRRFAGDLDGVVAAPVQKPIAVFVDRRPVAVDPHVGPAAEVRLEVARVVLVETARHPGPRLRADELPTSPAKRLALVVEHVDRHPSAGPPSDIGLIGSTGCGDRKHAPTSVPPEMLITGQRFWPTTSKYQRHGSSFQGSPVEPRMRSLRDRARAPALAVVHQRANRAWG